MATHRLAMDANAPSAVVVMTVASVPAIAAEAPTAINAPANASRCNRFLPFMILSYLSLFYRVFPTTAGDARDFLIATKWRTSLTSKIQDRPAVATTSPANKEQRTTTRPTSRPPASTPTEPTRTPPGKPFPSGPIQEQFAYSDSTKGLIKSPYGPSPLRSLRSRRGEVPQGNLNDQARPSRYFKAPVTSAQ